MIKKNCLNCGKEMLVQPCVKDRKKYCSKGCLYDYQKGKRSSIATEIKPGQRLSPKTEFKKGDNLREKHHNWKGGRYKLKNGYIWVYAPQHPRAYRNGAYEHILIMEKKLKRHLKKGEIVHHANHVKDDNRIENLILFNNNHEHLIYHKKIKKLKKEGK